MLAKNNNDNDSDNNSDHDNNNDNDNDLAYPLNSCQSKRERLVRRWRRKCLRGTERYNWHLVSLQSHHTGQRRTGSTQRTQRESRTLVGK